MGYQSWGLEENWHGKCKEIRRTENVPKRERYAVPKDSSFPKS